MDIKGNLEKKAAEVVVGEAKKVVVEQKGITGDHIVAGVKEVGRFVGYNLGGIAIGAVTLGAAGLGLGELLENHVDMLQEEPILRYVTDVGLTYVGAAVGATGGQVTGLALYARSAYKRFSAWAAKQETEAKTK